MQTGLPASSRSDFKTKSVLLQHLNKKRREGEGEVFSQQPSDRLQKNMPKRASDYNRQLPESRPKSGRHEEKEGGGTLDSVGMPLRNLLPTF
ncbi:hypothetical protein AVEN_46228-1 [Araneus ventricosus]|uniref:Uncharacterized protein n=1 Tax=Araneus ventricosus TaxID=182803 RepID=A0A4Y2W0G3_ARAVE|nr:hypothetical protein AVEN_46228-1 [Araneus ventricosus]